MTMTDQPLDIDRANLELNARHFRYDARYDALADAMDRNDTEAWSHLHPLLQERVSDYRDFRTAYRKAVAAGVIPDDRGPNAAA